MNTVDWFSKITLPVDWSTVSTMDVTAVVLPLSRTSGISESLSLCVTVTEAKDSSQDGAAHADLLTIESLVGIRPLIARFSMQ